MTNLYFPLPPGARWVYRGSGDAEGQLDIVTVLARRKTVMGVSCTVVHDEVREDGKARTPAEAGAPLYRFFKDETRAR